MANLNLALGRDPISAQLWLVVTDEPASLQTFQQYSERFQIEEELRKRKIQWLSTRTLRNPLYSHTVPIVFGSCRDDPALNGAFYSKSLLPGNGALVDAHWNRGNSYFRIGWNWFKGCLHQEWQLFPTILLLGGTDPDPAISSKKQAQQQFEREFTVKSYQFAA